MARTDLGQETPRNFTLFDAIVSVAAVGLALAFARTHLAYAWANLCAIPFRGPAGWAGVWAFLRTRTDVTGSIVMYHLRFDGSSPPEFDAGFPDHAAAEAPPALRRLIKQPGVVACEVWLLGMFLGICLAPLIEDYPLLSLIVVISTASAIPIAWTILVLRGQWETEPSWIDRLGRGLGVCWAVIIPLQAVFIYLSGCLPPHFQRSFSLPGDEPSRGQKNLPGHRPLGYIDGAWTDDRATRGRDPAPTRAPRPGGRHEGESCDSPSLLRGLDRTDERHGSGVRPFRLPVGTRLPSDRGHQQKAAQQVIQVHRQRFDVVINLCDGAWHGDTAGIDVVQALERLNMAFTGSGSAKTTPHARR